MANEVKRKSIQQNRAKHAWTYAEESKSKGDKLKDKYKSHVREFPMLVLTSGLVNAVAFAREKGASDSGWKLIYEHLGKWLRTDSEQTMFSFEEKELIHALLTISTSDSSQMRFLTNETISLFTWLKRFVS
jgi:CRISPR type III-B/RAMP module-associated protein Cmr5